MSMYRRNYPHTAQGAKKKWTNQDLDLARQARGENAPGEQRQPTRKQMRSPAQKRHAKREGVYRKLVAKGVSKEKAASRAMSSVPYLKAEKKGKTFHGVKARSRRAPSKMPRQYTTKAGVRKVKKVVKTRVKRKVRVAYRRYKRISLQEPRSGKKRLSYFAKGRKGNKKIPAWAIAGARSAKEFKTSDKFAKARARITKRRAAAARRMEKSGGPFTPNRRKRTMRKPTKASRSAAAKKGHRRRKAKLGAKRAKRPVGKGRGRLGVKLKRGKIYYKGRKPRVLKGKRRGVRRLPKARILLTNRKHRKYSANKKKRKSSKRAAAARKAWRTRRAGGAAPKRRRRRTRKLVANRRRKTGSRKYAANRKRSHKRHRGTKRRGRRFTANQFMADLKKLGVTALFAVTGFVAHKVITRLLITKVLIPALTPKAAAGMGAGEWKPTVIKWSPVLVGGVVAALGVAAVGYAAPSRRNEVGAGIIVSFFHTSILSLLGMSDSPEVKEAAAWIAGYDTSSTATNIGRYRQSMRGLGDAGQMSTLPRYVPTGRRGGIQQAVAGRRGAGEYFQASGMGEYFASGVQGIGAYELAGPLVTQAAAGLGQRIDDGIRPDANLDAVLTLAEAQAGVGEYYSADPSGNPYTLPEHDEWIPNNPLWAGTKSAEDSSETSEIPAGILETPGSNGIFG